MRIVIDDGSKAWSEALPEGTERISLGRALDNTVVIEDAAASREHCALELGEGGWTLKDLKSRNGTKLNGKALTEPTELSPGDRIQVGDSTVHFQEKKSRAKQATARGARQRGPLQDGVRFRLRVVSGAAQTKGAVVSALPFVVGSKESCGLVLEDDDVAAEHVMLVADRGQVHLVDLSGSATTLDGKPVRGRVVLSEGSQIGLGGSATLVHVVGVTSLRVGAGELAQPHPEDAELELPVSSVVSSVLGSHAPLARSSAARRAGRRLVLIIIANLRAARRQTQAPPAAGIDSGDQASQ